MRQSNKETARRALRKYIADLADQHECFMSMTDIDDLAATVLDRFLDTKVRARAIREKTLSQLSSEMKIRG